MESPQEPNMHHENRFTKNPNNRQGTDYEQVLATLFLRGLVENKYDFRLATERVQDEKFDDVYVHFEKDGEWHTYFVQAKHKANAEHLVTIEKLKNSKTYSLQKYMNSFYSIRQKFKGEWNNVTFLLCTTLFLDVSSIDVTEVEQLDWIFGNQHLGKGYKIQNEELRQFLLVGSCWYELAEDVSLQLFEKKSCLSVYKRDEIFLANEVLDVQKKKFQEKFIRGANLTSEALYFRDIFYRISNKYLQDVSETDFWETVKNMPINLSKTFGVLKIKNANIFIRELARVILNDNKYVPDPEFREKIKNIAGYVVILNNNKTGFMFNQNFFSSRNLPQLLVEFRNKLKCGLKKKKFPPINACELNYQLTSDEDPDIFTSKVDWPTDIDRVSQAINDESFVDSFLKIIIVNREEFDNNLKKLSDFVLLKKDEKVVFNPEFLMSNTLPPSFNDFRERLKEEVGDNVLLSECKFDETFLPEVRQNGKMYLESDVDEFFKKLVFVHTSTVDNMKVSLKDEMVAEYGNTDGEIAHGTLNVEMEKFMNFRNEGGEGVYLTPQNHPFLSLRDILYPQPALLIPEHVGLFTGRDEELIKLRGMMEDCENDVVVVSGKENIGKTELVLKHSKDCCNIYDKNVLLLDASNFEKSFKEVATRLHIPVKNRKGETLDINSVVERVFDFFSKRKVLFVFDNVSNNTDHERFIRTQENTSFILITRKSEIKLQRSDINLKYLSIEELTESEAWELLKNSLHLRNRDKLKDLADVLGYIPGVLAHAVTEILRSNLPVEEYIQKIIVEKEVERVGQRVQNEFNRNLSKMKKRFRKL